MLLLKPVAPPALAPKLHLRPSQQRTHPSSSGDLPQGVDLEQPINDRTQQRERNDNANG